jgi:hypothetical protein
VAFGALAGGLPLLLIYRYATGFSMHGSEMYLRP